VTRARGIEGITKIKNASLWRTQREPEWARWPMAAVTRLEAQSWVDWFKVTRLARPGQDGHLWRRRRAGTQASDDR
jgi:hypothetical protein